MGWGVPSRAWGVADGGTNVHAAVEAGACANDGVARIKLAAVGIMLCSRASQAPAHLPPSPGRYLARPYGRVDRPKLKRRLLERSIASGVRFYEAKVSRGGLPSGGEGGRRGRRLL